MRNFFLFFILFNLLSLTVYSQNNTLLKKTVSVKAEKISLKDVFVLISNQTGAVFSYNSQHIDNSQKITAYINNQSVLNVLQQLLPPSISIVENGKYIILIAQQPQQLLQSSRQLQQQEYETPVYNEKKQEQSVSTLINKKNDTLNLQITREFITKIKKIELLDSGKMNLFCHSCINSKNTKMMKKQIATLLVAVATTATLNQAIAQPQPEKPTEAENTKTFHTSFIYPLSSDGINSRNNAYKFSFNLLGGVTGGLKGFELGGLFNINHYSTTGVQFAGVFNKVNALKGAQFAGIFNMANSSNNAAQFAGVFNYSGGGKSTHQISGVANIADNAAVQIGGVANVANTSTVQIGGVVNLARKSKVQIGLINIADSADVMIGVVNLAKNGFMEFEVAGGEFMHTTASFRSGTKNLYGILSLGYNFDDKFWGYGYGVGTTFTINDKWGVNLEGIHYTLVKKFFEKNRKYNGLVQIRPLLYHQFGRRFKAFAGPVANLYIGNNTAENNLQISAPYTFWDKYGSKTKFEAWIGFSAGVRF